MVHEQFNLFGFTTVVEEPKRKKSIISHEERAKRKEKEEAHTAWKLLKSIHGSNLLTDRQKYLLQKYYSVVL